MSQPSAARPVAHLILTADILAALPHLPWTFHGDHPRPGDILMVGRALPPSQQERDRETGERIASRGIF